MPIMLYVALYGWLIAAAMLVSRLGAARGLIATTVLGFLLLTPATVPIASGLPPWSRLSAIAIGGAAAVLMFAPGVFRNYRFHWLDGFAAGGVLVWAGSNIGGSIGISQALIDGWWFAMFAAVPYFLARCVLATPGSLVLVSKGIVVGTLLMVPLFAYELQMSPRLHFDVYGFDTGNYTERYRAGGWRPRLFQPAGLGLAIWLAGSAVVAMALLWSRATDRVLRMPTAWAAGTVVVVSLLSRGAGAITLMIGCMAVLMMVKLRQSKMTVFAVPIAIILYLVTGITESQLPIRSIMADASAVVFGHDRAASLTTRFRNEAFVVRRAAAHPVAGWGGGGAYRHDFQLAAELGMSSILTDAMWIITLGQRGVLGLICLYGMFLLPGTMAARAAFRARLSKEAILVVVGLALFSWIYAADLLFNGFATPVQAIVAGGLTSFVVAMRSRGERLRARQQSLPARAITETRPRPAIRAVPALPPTANHL